MNTRVFIGRPKDMPLLHCPYCSHLIDCVTAVSDRPGATPEPGNYTICIYCAVWLRFEESVASVAPLRVRLATPEEIRALRLKNPIASKLEQAARQMAGRPRRG